MLIKLEIHMQLIRQGQYKTRNWIYSKANAGSEIRDTLHMRNVGIRIYEITALDT